jgi:hypothetical protein
MIVTSEKNISIWKDSQPILEYQTEPYFDSNTHDYNCRQGNLSGENIYYYCYNLQYTKSETPISEDGFIGPTKTTNYIIDLTLQKIKKYPKLSIWLKEGEYWADFEVVNAKCKKI